jgi:cyclohexanecarboxylate-CoA ligase
MLLAREPADLAIGLENRIVTTGDLQAGAYACARDLTTAGVSPGDRVVVALPNSSDFVSVYLAARLLAAVFVNVPWQWRRELVAVADETDARAVILPDDLPDDEARHPLASRRVALRTRSGVRMDPTDRDESAVAWLAYTSGTTGVPKGAVHSEETLRRIPEGFIERYDLGPSDAVLVAAPVGHAVGFVYGVQLALRLGSAMALLDRWDAAAAATAVERYGCTFVAAPTPLLLDLVEFAEKEGPDRFRGLRYFLCGGAPVSMQLLQRARSALPGTHVSAYYGTSECGGVTTCPPDAAVAKMVSTDGTPLPGMEIRLDGSELHVRGVQLASGYWVGDDEGRFRADGWFATGDLARIDADGYVRITGRVKDIIIRGGLNISPLEVEETLNSHPRIREAAVVGVPDARLGERVVAAIVVSGEAPTLDEIRTACRSAGLAKVKWPEAVVCVDGLVRTPTGKVRRAEVRRVLEETLASCSH